MIRKFLITLALSLMLSALAAWSPWVTPWFAEQTGIVQFNLKWMNVIDGCGFNCEGCGATGYRKAAFGAHVTLQYGCGLIYPGEPLKSSDIFISFLGTAHGIPKP
jgi:hypothetical protein